MANKMLIDASHPEETRVVVVRGQKVEEFDFEAANRKQLRGNIYLAKVTRVEPSLQAAFVEYGGNRHGFLAFSEIHPDYYQIPVADRQALLEEEAKADRDMERDEERRSRRKPRREAAKEAGEDNGDTVSEDAGDEDEVVEQVGAGDALDEISERPRQQRRQYKIQEVIKRRQILLVQVVKEERGNKGAALTTYLSLAGRYSVLMPNTARGGGISRKITSADDRKRLKTIAQDLEVPEGMGVILRTAGAARTKAEIKRDFEYLMRMWESVREATMSSSAPALVYEEGSLIKRAIRDLYNKDIDEVLVSGEEGYREAKDFMRMLMPSHAKAVKPHREPAPVFAKFGVEAQLDAMFSNQVQLRSGGYLVINPTEALVSIDVNSGRATREHNIEDTALKTNLEAAEEIARQLRLRDLAGLIVIDFIDMEEKRNNRSVEKRMKDCLKNDRARIQIGRISSFGLLEMSRQRIRTGVLESSSVPCPHCAGTGFIRATPSVALHILRAIEETLIKSASYNLQIRAPLEVAFYILNQKRAHLRELELRFGVTLVVAADPSLTGAGNYAIDKTDPATPVEPRGAVTGIQAQAVIEPEPEEPEIVEEDEIEEDEEATAEAAPAERTRREPSAPREEAGPKDETEGGRRRRRRRRRRGRNGDTRDGGPMRVEIGGDDEAREGDEGDEDDVAIAAQDGAESASESVQVEPVASGETDEAASDEPAKPARRRRPRRGKAAEVADAGVTDEVAEAAPPAEPVVAAEPDAKPARKPRRSRAKVRDADPVALADDVVEAAAMEAPVNGAAKEPALVEKPEPGAPAPAEPIPEPVAVILTPPDPDRPKRAGWWSKAKSVLGG
jgi:ribonuclease E